MNKKNYTKFVAYLIFIVFLLAMFSGCQRNPSVKTVHLLYEAQAGGMISGAFKQTLKKGGISSEVTAVADIGYMFDSWSDGITTATRQETNVQSNMILTATFKDDWSFKHVVRYSAGVGGHIDGLTEQITLADQYGSWVTAIPDEAYEFLKWSDGLTNASRLDLITEPINLVAEFIKKQYNVKYSPNKGGKVRGQLEQTIKYNDSSSTVTAIADKGYRFISWSDGILTPTRWDEKVKTDIEVRATFAPVDAVTFKILMVFVNEINAILETNTGEMVEVNYKITDDERKVFELITPVVSGFLNDIFAGSVLFEFDTFFTTIPLGRENIQWGSDSGFYSYSVSAKDIPEVASIIEDYRSVLTTFNFNDYDHKVHIGGGSAGKKFGAVHAETIFGGLVVNGQPVTDLLDLSNPYTKLAYRSSTELYLHEFTHTVSMGLEIMGLHTAIKKYLGGNGPIYEQLEVIVPYLLNTLVIDGKVEGIPYEFWKGDGK